MAFYTARELAEHINVASTYIRVWTNRKNLHKGADGLYDTDHPLNAMWIKLKRAEYYGKPKHVEKRERQRKGIPETVKSIPVIKDTVKKKLEKKNTEKKTDWNDSEDIANFKQSFRERDNSDDQLLGELARKKEKLAIEKQIEDIKLIRAKNAKISGETIPTELVVSSFSIFGKATVTAFLNGADDILTNISAMKGLTREEHAKLKGDLKRIINSAANDAVRIAQAQIDNIVDEYSQNRSRGERT